MNNLSSLYNTLFSIEIMVFGIITAVVFVFIQIININFSYRLIKYIIRNSLLVIYFIISGIVLLATALGSFLMSIGAHDLFPSIYFGADFYFLNQYFILALLVFFFLSIILFLVFVAVNFRYLRPSKILLISEKAIRYREIRLFLLKKNGISSPDELGLMDLLKDDEKKNKKIGKSIEINKDDIDLDSILNNLKEYKQKSPKYKKYLKRYMKLKKQIKSSTDPLEPINYIIIQSIKRMDLRTLDEAIEALTNITNNFIESMPKSKKEEPWDPDSELLYYYSIYLLENTEMFIEICGEQKIDSLKLKVLGISGNYTDLLLEIDQTNALFPVLSFWKKVADNSIGKSSETFKKIISYYDKCGKAIFNSNERVLDEVFRNLGWLGERLLSKKEFEEKPLISDIDYYTEYDELMSCIISFGDEFKRNPSKYPLIYFDAVLVVFLKLILLFIKNKENSDLKENLLDCIFIHYYFAEEAIESGNSRGAGLAVQRIHKYYKELVKNKLDDEVRIALEQLAKISLKAAAFSEKLEKVDFLFEKIDEWAKKKLIETNSPDIISNVLHEGLIKTSDGDYDLVWKYIIELGHEMQTNFGFMFDWKTGKLYSDDDPRRV